MALGSIYKDLLEKQIILSHLRQGEIPHKKQVDAEFKEAIKDNPTLDKPFTDPEQYLTKEKEKASTLKFNKTLDGLVLDLSALYNAAIESAQISTDLTDKTINELKVLDKAVADLDDIAANLLLLSTDIEGFGDFVFENFSNTDKVDMENTDASIDNNTQTLQLPISKHSRIPTNLTSADVHFNPVSRVQLISNQSEPNSEPLNALGDQNKVWIQKISFSQPPAEFQGEYTVRLPQVSEISKIIVRPITADKGSITNLILQYSNDGINWLDTPGEFNKRLLTDTSFYFEPTKANFWRFFFSKVGYDEFIGDAYIYKVGAKAIEFYGIEHEQNPQRISEAVFYSLPQSSERSTDINKVSLKVCELVPTGTSIDYQIAFMTEDDHEDYLDNQVELPDLVYSDIDPVNRAVKIRPAIIDGAKMARLQNMGTTYGLDSITSHKYISNINNVLVAIYDLGPTVTSDTIEVWRNLGNNATDAGGGTPVKVNNIETGWTLNGDYYTSEFYISDPNGRVTDFGPNEVEIDTLRSSGRVNLRKGKHKIRTHRRNWLSINPSSVSSPSDPNPDLLYPYNHKYLIEGLGDLLYGSDLTEDVGGGTTRGSVIDPDELYVPVEKYWGKTLKQIPSFDFAFKVEDDDYSVYTIVEDVDGNKRVLVKYSTEPNLFTNEKFAIIEDQITGALYKFVVLKAVLKSTKKASSPILDSYTIRLGL